MRKKIGVVGVDSGQIIICDPCYIDGQWKNNDEHLLPPSIYKDKKTGRTYALAFHNEGYSADVMFSSWEDKLDDYDGKTPNQVMNQWELMPVPKEYDHSGEFSYRGCCHTGNPFGQLKYSLGHDGVAVTSRTQYGDGTYPVYAELDNEGRPERIIIEFGDGD